MQVYRTIWTIFAQPLDNKRRRCNHASTMPKRSSIKSSGNENRQPKSVVDYVTPIEPKDSGASSAAALLGRLGGLKGGKARANALSKKRRSEIARIAAEARWKAERGGRHDH